jgi:putative glycosyltransferase (TIGR04372 family)
MGDPSMKPLAPRDQVVDYAHSPLKSDWLDVFLAATCRFWLGTNSGVFMLASSFGVPVALTNVAPATFRPWSSGDLFIPKLYRSLEDGRILSFAESLKPHLFTSHDLDPAHIAPVDNDPVEIASLAREMLDRLEGRWTGCKRYDALQEQFLAVQPSYYPVPPRCRIGSDFLALHADLLEAVPAPAPLVAAEPAQSAST